MLLFHSSILFSHREDKSEYVVANLILLALANFHSLATLSHQVALLAQFSCGIDYPQLSPDIQKHFVIKSFKLILMIRCIWATRTAALSYSRFLDITTKPDCGYFQKLSPTVTNQGAIGFGTAVNCAFYCSGDKSIPYMAKVEVPDLNLASSRSSVCITTQPRVQLPKRIRRGFTCSLYDQPRPESHPTSPSYVE